MKFLIAVVLIAVGVFADPPSPEIIKIATDCLGTAGLTATPEEADDILHMEKPADTPQKKCYIKCFAERTFVLDAAGKPNSTTLTGAGLPMCFDKAKMTAELIAECGSKTGATPCDVGYEVGKCLWEKAGKPH